MAWVGMARDDADKSVLVASQFGGDADYPNGVGQSWADNEQGRRPTGTAIRERATQVNSDVAHNPRMRPWRDEALKRGYRSCIALPLREGDIVFGALTIYADTANIFGQEEIQLLEQLADDLSYGIAALRTEDARRQAVAGHSESEERFRLVLDNAADAVLIADPTGHFVYANQQVASLLGYCIGDLLTLGVSDIVPPEEIEPALDRFRRLQVDGRLRSEVKLQCRDGSVVPAEITAVRLPNSNLYAAFRDITERKRYEAQLEYSATHDPLTALANRNLTFPRIC
jgi:PAS domain S-box-containing protein